MSGHYVTGISAPLSPVTVKATPAFQILYNPRDVFNLILLKSKRNRAAWNIGQDYCHTYLSHLNAINPMKLTTKCCPNRTFIRDPYDVIGVRVVLAILKVINMTCTFVTRNLLIWIGWKQIYIDFNAEKCKQAGNDKANEKKTFEQLNNAVFSRMREIVAQHQL